jgi:hypothetical protein
VLEPTDARARVEVSQATRGAAETVFTLARDANNWLRSSSTQAGSTSRSKRAGAETTAQSHTTPPRNASGVCATNARATRFRSRRAWTARTWVARRVVARPFAAHGLTIELGAGAASRSQTPGKAVFDNFLLESNPTPFVPLYSAPTRTPRAVWRAPRASLWDATRRRARRVGSSRRASTGMPTLRGIADARDASRSSSRTRRLRPRREQNPPAARPSPVRRWPVQLFASYRPQRCRRCPLEGRLRVSRARIYGQTKRAPCRSRRRRCAPVRNSSSARRGRGRKRRSSRSRFRCCSLPRRSSRRSGGGLMPEYLLPESTSRRPRTAPSPSRA